MKYKQDVCIQKWRKRVKSINNLIRWIPEKDVYSTLTSSLKYTCCCLNRNFPFPAAPRHKQLISMHWLSSRLLLFDVLLYSQSSLVRPDSRLGLGLASPNSDSDSWAGLESKISQKRLFLVIFTSFSHHFFGQFSAIFQAQSSISCSNWLYQLLTKPESKIFMLI